MIHFFTWFVLSFIVVIAAHSQQTASNNVTVVAEDAVKLIMRPFLNWFVPGSGRWIGHMTYSPDWSRANGVEALCNLLLYHSSLAEDEEQLLLEMLYEVQVHQGDSFYQSADYFDDILWWSLAFMRAYEVSVKLQSSSNNRRTNNLDGFAFLSVAMKINDVVTTDSCEKDQVCGDFGCYWSRSFDYKNAITNELYFTSSAKLARLATTAEDRTKYTQRAQRSISWFLQSGMINASTSLVVDGLSATCAPTGEVYTYNQGVLLGGFTEFALVQSEQANSWSLGRVASEIVDAATTKLIDPANGVLTESSCGDGALFKGIFTRYLRYFLVTSAQSSVFSIVTETQRQEWQTFLQVQAQSIWDRARDSKYQTSYVAKSWNREYDSEENPTTGQHTAYHNAQIAAMDGISTTITPQNFTSDGSACSGHGYLVHYSDNTASCSCFTRYSGATCSDETTSWAAYYANVSITLSSSFANAENNNENMGKLICMSNFDQPEPVTACVTDDDLAQKAGFTVELVNNVPNAVRLRVSASSTLYLAVSKDTRSNYLVRTMELNETATLDETLFSVTPQSGDTSSYWNLEEVSVYSLAYSMYVSMNKDEFANMVSVGVSSSLLSPTYTVGNSSVLGMSRFLVNIAQYCP